MYLPLRGIVSRKPAVEPSLLPLSMTHVPSSADWGSRNWAGSQAERLVSWSLGSRFMNHEESGTSSRLFTLTASPPRSNAKDSDRGRKTMLSTPSQMIGDWYISGAQLT